MTGAGTDRSKESRCGGPAIILVRPQLAVNIGMSARAMANFGLADLRLVAPRENLAQEGKARAEALAAAAGAAHLIDSATVFETAEAATLGLNFIWATTARERGQLKPVLTPSEAMPLCAGRMPLGEKHGVLFGPERTGLGNDDVALANAIITFPVNPAYGSLNLAQAVLLIAYEWMRAETGGKPPFSMPQRSPAAPAGMVAAFFRYLESELERSGFFRPAHKQPVMRRNLRNIFHRMQLTEQDVRTLHGMVVRLAQGPRRGGRPAAEENAAAEPPEPSGPPAPGGG